MLPTKIGSKTNGMRPKGIDGAAARTWVSRGEWQAATVPHAHVRGAAEVERTMVPETLACIHEAAEESGNRRTAACARILEARRSGRRRLSFVFASEQ